jgi:hypothetical protein
MSPRWTLLYDALGEGHQVEEWGDVAIGDLELPTRILLCLRDAGFKTLGEVALKTKGELLRMPNFWHKSYGELVILLRDITRPHDRPILIHPSDWSLVAWVLDHREEVEALRRLTAED